MIVAIDGFEVADARSALYRMTTRGVGNTAKVDLLRKGRPVSVNVSLAAPPAAGRDDVRNLSGKHPFDGARVSNLLPGVADELGIDDDQGVVILSVRNGSIAANLGFRPGDVIQMVGRQQIVSVVDLDKALREAQRVWVVTVKRGERVLQLQVPG